MKQLLKCLFCSFLLLATTFNSTKVYGQQIQFCAQPVDTIFVRTLWSAYQFDEHGSTKGESDVIIYAYDSNLKYYKIINYYRDKFLTTSKPEKLKVKSKKYTSEIGKKIASENLKALLVSLETSVQPKELFQQIDSTIIRVMLNEKRIRMLAKRYKLQWLFRNKYSSTDKNEQLFRSITSIDSFKVYLLNRFDAKGYVFVTDVSSTLNIKITTKDSIYRFEGKYPNPVMQPWYQHHNNIFDIQMILNLNINKELYDFLPSNFLLKEDISTEALVNDYIKWCFERRKFIY